MITLWIVLGCFFCIMLGCRFTYKVLGLTRVEAVAIYLLIITLTVVNTAPIRVLIGKMF